MAPDNEPQSGELMITVDPRELFEKMTRFPDGTYGGEVILDRFRFAVVRLVEPEVGGNGS